jgi:hypothetical protein
VKQGVTIQGQGKVESFNYVKALPCKGGDCDNLPIDAAKCHSTREDKNGKRCVMGAGLFNGNLQYVHDNITAVALGPTTINSKRELKVSFSLPFYFTGQGIMVKAVDPTAAALDAFFTNIYHVVPAVACIAAFAVLIGVLSWRWEMVYDNAGQDARRFYSTRPVKGIGQACSFVMSSIIDQQYVKKPSHPMNKLLSTFLGLFPLLVFSLLVGIITTASEFIAPQSSASLTNDVPPDGLVLILCFFPRAMF